MFAAIAKRVFGILTRPGTEWPVIAGESVGRNGFILAYAAVLLTIPPLVLVALGVVGIGFANASAATVLTIGVTGLLATMSLVLLLAVIVRWVARALDVAMDYGHAFSFTIHATTPMWISAAIGNMIDPIQRLLAVVAFGWAIVLIAKGATAMLGIAREKRGVFTYTIALSLILLWLIVLGAVLGVVFAVLGGDVAGQFARAR